jgi:hypothetical protein
MGDGPYLKIAVEVFISLQMSQTLPLGTVRSSTLNVRSLPKIRSTEQSSQRRRYTPLAQKDEQAFMQIAGIISKQSRGENIDEPALYIIPNYVRLPQPPSGVHYHCIMHGWVLEFTSKTRRL